jgi:hypothetical protein
MKILDIELSDKEVVSIYTTALEGGIGYWAIADEYKWQYLYEDWENDIVHPLEPDQVLVVLSDTEDDDFKDEQLTPAKIRAGVKLLIEKYPHMYQIINDNEFHVDADGADAVVQLGLFGEIVYG